MQQLSMTRMNKDEKKKVSFSSTQTLFISVQCLSSDERKKLCWYTQEDLHHSRTEVRDAIRVLQSMEGNMDAVDKSQDNICLRGIEKYADAVGKYRNQRLFIESVLQQHATRPDAESLAILSRYMSQPSTKIALFYAAKSAAELERIRQLEKVEVEGKAEDAPFTSPWIEVTRPKFKELEDAPRCTSSSSKKRARSPCFDEITLQLSRKIQCCE
jgi:hypothetical protein